MKKFNDADKAKEYIIKEIMPNFSDSSFSQYITYHLAGDFACHLAESWEELKHKNDDMINAFGETIDDYTNIHAKCWELKPEEVKELMTSEFPMIQTTQMQLAIKRIGDKEQDRGKARDQILEYSKV